MGLRADEHHGQHAPAQGCDRGRRHERRRCLRSHRPVGRPRNGHVQRPRLRGTRPLPAAARSEPGDLRRPGDADLRAPGPRRDDSRPRDAAHDRGHRRRRLRRHRRPGRTLRAGAGRRPGRERPDLGGHLRRARQCDSGKRGRPRPRPRDRERGPARPRSEQHDAARHRHGPRDLLDRQLGHDHDVSLPAPRRPTRPRPSSSSRACRCGSRKRS